MAGSLTAKGVVSEFLDRLRRLPAVGQAVVFRKGARFRPESGRRAVWTNVLLNTLVMMGRDQKLTVYPGGYYLSRDSRGQYHNSKYDRPKKRDDVGEFLVDLIWGSWGADKNKKWWADPRDKNARFGIDLACESEWGWLKGHGEDYHMETMFNDFSKLIDIKSPIKLFIGTTNGTEMTRTFFDCGEAMAKKARNRTRGEEYAFLFWDDEAPWARDRARPVSRIFTT